MGYIIILSILSCFLVLGCTMVQDSIKKSKNLSEEKTLSDETSISVNSTNGNIAVYAMDETDSVAVEAEIVVRGLDEAKLDEYLSQVSFRFETDGEKFQIEPVVPDNWRTNLLGDRPKSWSVNFEISVPKGLNVECESTNGNVNVAGENADVLIQTTNGNVAILENTGDINLRTLNGNATVANVRKSGLHIDQHTQNGNITLEIPDAVDGEFSLASTNGKIKVMMPSMVSPSLDARTTNGNVILEVGDRISSRLSLKTTNGRVTCGPDVSGEVKRTRIEGTIGSGEGEISATTTNGSIKIEQSTETV